MTASVKNEDTAPVLRPTNDYGAMRSLALRSGLEDGSFEDYVAAYGYFVGDRLVGCAALKIKDGVFTVECLAVSQEFREKGMGRTLVTLIEREARARGAGEVWAIARSPAFFVRIGYGKADTGDSRGPSLKGCEACKQFRRSCTPSIVHRIL
jgi:N-acetylglutamate synthase-like GNAT family acetyltransferase